MEAVRKLEEQNEQMSRYLLDLSWQKDAMKAHLHMIIRNVSASHLQTAAQIPKTLQTLN